MPSLLPRLNNGTFDFTWSGPGISTLQLNIAQTIKKGGGGYGPLVSPFPKNDFDLCQKINFTAGNETYCSNCKENLLPEQLYGTQILSGDAERQNSAGGYFEPTATHCTCPPPLERTCYTRSLSPPTTQESSSSTSPDRQREHSPTRP